MHDPLLLPAWAAALGCLLGAAATAVRGRTVYPGPASALFHVAMLLSMAGMWTLPGAHISAPVWRGFFGALAAAAALWLLLAATGPRTATTGDEISAAAYHGIAALAMVYALLGGHGGAPPWPVAGWILVALFLLDAAVVAGVTRYALAALPHLVMDLATALMLGSALRG
ncbi:DUF5134 domain-containing protein [Nocardia sp. NPDC050697]|uniref:DUF5134 domain-containing protein n=1 Tax=Nocardia sp. NPDC050697 TaxID=3155158 RepID=UPI0033EBBCB3